MKTVEPKYIQDTIFTPQGCACFSSEIAEGKKSCCKKYKRKGKFCGGCPKK